MLFVLAQVDSARAERPLLFHKDQITLKASPQEAWDAIKTFEKIDRWHPATEAAPGGCSTVVWSGQFQSPEETAKPDQDDAATMKLVQGVFRSGLENLEKITKH